MYRKTIALCAALTALGALALTPAGASATTLKDTIGGVVTKVDKGKKITAIATTEVIFDTGELEVKCTESSLTGEIINSGTDLEGAVEETISAATFSGNKAETKCDGGIIGAVKVDIVGLPWCLKVNGGLDTWTLSGADACGSAGTFTLIFTSSLGTCTYKRTASISGTYTTPIASNPSELTVTGNPQFETEQTSTAFCPAGVAEITKMAFKLYTDTETYAKSEEDPIWLSKS